MTEYVAFKEADGTIVNEGDEIIDFRGDKARFGMVTRGEEYNGTGKVVYTGKGPRKQKGECYAGVFNLRVMSKEDYIRACQFIDDAKEASIDLSLNDFRYTPEGLTLDGMEPEEWLEAQTME